MKGDTVYEDQLSYLAKIQILPSSNGWEMPQQHSSWCHFCSSSPNSNQEVQGSVATVKTRN